MSGDIVERLRSEHRMALAPIHMSDAADEIERLEAARQQLLNAARGYMDMVCEERDKNERLRALADKLAEALAAVKADRPTAHTHEVWTAVCDALDDYGKARREVTE